MMSRSIAISFVAIDLPAGPRAFRAAFWITVRGRFLHIEDVALRDPQGAYLGSLQVTQPGALG
jgi:DUF438 domain-containing protein